MRLNPNLSSISISELVCRAEPIYRGTLIDPSPPQITQETSVVSASSTLYRRRNNTWQARSCAYNPSRRKTSSDAAGRISKVARLPLLHSGESLQGGNAGMAVEETWPRRRGALSHAVYRNTLCDIIL